MSPAGLGTKNDCIGEDQQQFTSPTDSELRIGKDVEGIGKAWFKVLSRQLPGWTGENHE
jgi:hypothetical protein